MPLPVLLPETYSLEAPIVATGGDLKNASALAFDRSVFLTQHIGDLAHPRMRTLQSESICTLETMFKAEARVAVCDLHPGYVSAHYAEDLAASRDLPLDRVQHHHAHIAGRSTRIARMMRVRS